MMHMQNASFVTRGWDGWMDGWENGIGETGGRGRVAVVAR